MASGTIDSMASVSRSRTGFKVSPRAMSSRRVRSSSTTRSERSRSRRPASDCRSFPRVRQANIPRHSSMTPSGKRLHTTSGPSTRLGGFLNGPKRPEALGKAPVEESLDGAGAVRGESAGAGAGEVRVSDHGAVSADRRPQISGPRKPSILVLIEHVHRLVTQFGELRSPAGAAADGEVILNGADHVD